MGELLGFAQDLLNAGGWTVVVFLVATLLIGLWRRWWVPGFWFDDKATALKDAVEANAGLREANTELRVENARLRTEVVRERRRRRDDAPA